MADQIGWLLGDVACLAIMALFIPLVPVFKAFERGKRAGDGK